MIPYFSYTQIQIGMITIQFWGLMFSLSFLTALFLSLKEAKKKDICEDHIWNIMILALVGMFAGSRSLYIISNYEKIDSFIEALVFFDGGFSFAGGLVLSFLFAYFYIKIRKLDLWIIADIFTQGFIAAIIIIRVGCLIVYDHVGEITSMLWGRTYIDGSVRHPVSLYLVIGNIVIFSIIWYVKKRKYTPFKGFLFLIFMLCYSILRFFLDFMRCSDLEICDVRHYNLTYTQLIVLFLIPVLLLAVLKKYNKTVLTSPK